MKISTKLFNQQQVSRFGKLNEEIQSLQNKISTGKNIVQASDDPIGAVNLSGYNKLRKDLVSILEMLIMQLIDLQLQILHYSLLLI